MEHEATGGILGAPLVRLVGTGQANAAPPDFGPELGRRNAALAAAVTAIAATGVIAPGAVAAPGDLDPDFGDVGRVGIDLYGELWSVQVRDDESIDFAGGSEYCSYWTYDCDLFDVIGHVGAFGAPDGSYTPANLDHTFVQDTALLADGRLVGVGRLHIPSRPDRLTVFRLLPNGALDATFGVGGKATLVERYARGYAVAVDDDGKIVVAGSSGGQLILVRFLENGALDTSFGTAGVSVVASVDGHAVDGPTARISRASGGGYRVLAAYDDAGVTRCGVVGITATGALDPAVGTGGLVQVPTGIDGSSCNALAVLPGGDLIVAGNRASGGFLTRVLSSGAPAPGFDAASVASTLEQVSAVTVSTTGKIFVAGHDRSGLTGATIMRLLASGALDGAFGQGGSMLLEPESERPGWTTVRDMQVRANDALVLAADMDYKVAVARLLGDVGRSGPGVLGMTEGFARVLERDGEATVKVHRSGGATGSVTVSFEARAFTGDGSGGALAGDDFTPVTGELTWASGDTSEREITVPIATDATDEDPEAFEVVLHSPTGGAGIGATGTSIEIAGRSYPFGDFNFSERTISANERDGTVYFGVRRAFYSQGPVTVTLRLLDGSATAGADFTIEGADASNTLLLSFADGEAWKTVAIQLVSDSADESTEDVRLELTSPTGGAVLGSTAQMRLTIFDTPSSGGGGSGGGGGGGGGGLFTGVESLLLGLLAALRGRRRAAGR